jgi:hypothetical protein
LLGVYLQHSSRISRTDDGGGAPITFNSVGSNVKAQEAWFIKTVAGAGNVTVTLDVDSSAFTTYTPGGTVVYANSQTYSNNLGTLGKYLQTLQLRSRPVGRILSRRAGCFRLASNCLEIHVLEAVYQTPNPPQWNAMVAFSH